MKVLITGGAGCLGSNIVEHLLPKVEKIVVLDNFATSKTLSLPIASNLDVVEGSVADDALVAKIFGRLKPEVVIHGAASYKDPHNWVDDVTTNVLGTIQIIRACERWSVRRLVNLQTALCYGIPQTTPIPVNHPIAPITSYGITKAAGEAFVLQSDVSHVSLRISNVVAPRLSVGPIPAFYKRLKLGEKCTVTVSTRDFLDFRDFIQCLMLVIERQEVNGVLNVASGEGHSVAEVFHIVADHLQMVDRKPDQVIQPSNDDIPTVVLDPSLTRQLLGWHSKISFEESVRSILAWYDEFGVTDIYSHLRSSH